MQLKENPNLVTLSLKIYFGEEYRYTLRLSRWLLMFNLRFKKKQISVYIYIYMNEKETKKKKTI